ncbi:hypothetical protein V6Z12_A02G079100 [Gossypium hirsutum]
MTFMEAPKSHIAFFIPKWPILYGIANMPLFLYFAGIFCCNTVDTFSPMFTLSLIVNFPFLVQSSLRNFAHRKICLMTSNSSILILAFLNASRISLSSLPLRHWYNLPGNGC